MTHTANHSVPEQGKLRRALGTAWAFLQSLESTSFDYTFERIERLEREVERLKKEIDLRAHDGSQGAAGGERCPPQSER